MRASLYWNPGDLIERASRQNSFLEGVLSSSARVTSADSARLAGRNASLSLFRHTSYGQLSHRDGTMNDLTAHHLHDMYARGKVASWPHEVWAGALACRECALRVLVLLLNSPQWVMRRVERVAFHDDRTAVRRVSMDFLLPDASPRYQVANGQVVCLVPLTVMRRKTLVNFGLSDVDGRALSLMGMRHTQALTEQIVLALAEITPGVTCSPEVTAFAHALAYGTQQELEASFALAESERGNTDLSRLLADRGVGHLLRRLANNFLLLVTIDEVGPPHRIVRFSYDEPLTLTYKSSGYDATRKAYVDQPRKLPVWAPRRLSAAIGWSPTVISFPIPAAENTQSYHFEIEAPAGVMIASASLVAGRPNEDHEPPSWDHVAGGFPVVGLHACDVPNGSLSQAQVQLRLNRRGWLTASLLACLLSTALLWATALTATRGDRSTVATAILTITAAVIVFVVKPTEHQMASRIVTSVRATATISMFLLVAVGSFITFVASPAYDLLHVAAVGASLCSLLVVLAWLRAQPSQVQISPWEQGLKIKQSDRLTPTSFPAFEDARRHFDFHRPSVKVESSEGDHREAFEWTSLVEETLNQRLLTALRHRTRA